jgi:hypothetical protein
MNEGLSDTDLKVLFKQALVEVLEERRELFYDLFAEVIEDAGLANAIREGYSDERVTEAEIFRLLDGDDETRVQS